jgi:hypothetical protein
MSRGICRTLRYHQSANLQLARLLADTVNWSMIVRNGQNCRYGTRYAKVQFERMTLVSPPRSGRVVLQGSAFTYVPKKDFLGDDSFDLEIAGQIQKVRGASTIHIVVSVRSATKSAEPVRAAAPAPTPTADNANQTLPVPRSGGPTPLIEVAHGPAPVPTPPAPGAGSGSRAATRLRSCAYADAAAIRRSAGADASRSDRLVGGSFLIVDHSRQKSLNRFGANVV